ncbi:hypothetical protein WA026_017820 [Henosepilachna vigintioctopunctata]|uniref:CHK kinase-like domain-containing protein n=1 Tax=Henosepilachna vigintioctopunctata TaxID=420089 RepID=A0AAW1TVM0_9CUCU
MSITISDKQKRFIDQIALKEGFKEYNLSLDQGSLKGDGYMGTIYVVKIEENSTKRKLNLILKVAHTDDKIRKETPTRLTYIRENYMYNVVFKEFRELQKEYHVKKVFDGTAKYYGGLEDIKEECLVLENLKEIGFTIWNRLKPMDAHHVEAVMAQYGKFHALSYALKKFNQEKYSEIAKNLQSAYENLVAENDFKSTTISSLGKAFEAVEGNADATAGLNRFIEKSYEFFHETVRIKDKYTVITHGDCWASNLMFKYEDAISQKPSQVYILDWQASTTGSPILDTSFFFYTCTKDCLDNFKYFLKVYYENMSSMLKQFGVKVEEIISFQDLEQQWQIYSKFGMYTAILLIKMMLTKQEEAPEWKEMVKENKTQMDMFDLKISNEEEYNERVRNIVNHMVENNFI